MKCDVCNQVFAVRRGVLSNSYLALTCGVFCDTCIAYPNGYPTIERVNEAMYPGKYWIERLPETLSRPTGSGNDNLPMSDLTNKEN